MKDEKSIILVSDVYLRDNKFTFSVMDNQGNLEPHRPYWTDYSIVGQEYVRNVERIMNNSPEAFLLIPDYLVNPTKMMWVLSHLYKSVLKEVDKKFEKLEKQIHKSEGEGK